MAKTDDVHYRGIRQATVSFDENGENKQVNRVILSDSTSPGQMAAIEPFERGANSLLTADEIAIALLQEISLKLDKLTEAILFLREPYEAHQSVESADRHTTQ